MNISELQRELRENEEEARANREARESGLERPQDKYWFVQILIYGIIVTILFIIFLAVLI